MKRDFSEYTGTPAQNLTKAIDTGDSEAAELFADQCELELYERLESKRSEHLRVYANPPPVQYFTTMLDGPTWEVSEQEAIKNYGYTPPNERAEYYRNRIKARLDDLNG